MNTHMIHGCGTALATPFRDNGEVDYDAYSALVRRQVEGGMHFLVALGSTAETPCLEDDEKKELLALTRANAPELPIVAGAGTNSLRHTIRNMRLLEDADMYLMVVPYYNKPTQQGMYEYFKALASETDKPILLYNVPGRTGVHMSASTTLRLAEIPNIVGIKEASGNLSQVRTIITEAPAGFKVFSGNDDQTLDIMLDGGAGVISVASNVAPKMMVEFVEAAERGDFNTASGLFRRLIPLFDACFVESNPIPVKAALSALGYCTPQMRLPLVQAEPSTMQLMQKIVTKVD